MECQTVVGSVLFVGTEVCG